MQWATDMRRDKDIQWTEDMRWTKEKFLSQEMKTVTLMGMSGVGKTYLAGILTGVGWFHYSIDYQIAAKYLNKKILANIRSIACRDPFLKGLIESGSIDIVNKVSVDNLNIVSTYLGMIGDPKKGGLSIEEFRVRQNLYLDAEVSAIDDIPQLINKRVIESNLQSILIDTTGSLCEIEDDSILRELSKHTVLVYIKATENDEKELLRRAMANPKPLFYPEMFFKKTLREFMDQNNLKSANQIDPNEFYVFAFPKLFYYRLPKYESIAKEYGHTVSKESISNIKSESEFIDVVARAIEAKTSSSDC